MNFALNRQHWGDSYKLMAHVPDGQVDLAHYSPPYIAGKSYEDETSSGIATYKAASDRMFGEVARVLKPNGVFALEIGFFQHPKGKGRFDPLMWQGANTIRPMMYELWRIAEKHGLHVVQEIIWHTRGGLTGHPDRKRIFNRHEYVIILSPDPDNIHFSREELRDLEGNVSYSSANNPFGAGPASVWIDGEAAANSRLREIARAMADGRATYDEAKLAFTETIADFLSPNATGAVDELMRLAKKLKPGAPSRAKPLLDTNKVLGDTFCNSDGSVWLIERVTGAADHKYHECPFPLELVDNVIRLFSPPNGIVLDPFAGSCMVGKGALMSGRNFLTFERDEYWKKAVTKELEYLKWLLKTWLAEGAEGLVRRDPKAPKRLPDPPCDDVLTYTGDDVDLRVRCLQARRALQKYYLAETGRIINGLRASGEMKPKGSKHDEVISESGLCSCPHCQTWLR